MNSNVAPTSIAQFAQCGFMKPRRSQNWLIFLSCFFTLGLGAQSVETKVTTADDELVMLEAFEVKSFRSSLQDAIDLKREASSIVDAVQSEDLGKLPDISIAESLARLPGVTAGRVRGNASELNIRGMGGDFGITLLNGREQTSPRGSRQVDFSQYPDELLTGAVVHKSPTASLLAGGLSGTVNMTTIDPLAYSNSRMISGVRMSYSDLGAKSPDADSVGYRANFAYVDQLMDGELGYAVGYARLEQPNVASGPSFWGYANAAVDLNSDGELDALSWGSGLNSRGGTEIRDGYMGVVKWRPSEDLEVSFDVMISEFSNEDAARSVWIGSAEATNTAGDPNAVRDVVVSNNAAVAGTIQRTNPWWGLNFQTVNQANTLDDELQNLGINTVYRSGDFKFSADLSYSRAVRSSEFFGVYSQPYDISGAWPNAATDLSYTFDIRGASGGIPKISVNKDLQDQDTNLIYRMEGYRGDNEDELVAGRIDGEWYLEGGWINSLQAGIDLSTRSKEFSNSSYLPWITPVAIPAGVASNFSLVGAGTLFDQLPAFLAFDATAVALDLFSPIEYSISDSQASSNWVIDEDVRAAFVQANFSGEIGGLSLTGNIGIRGVRTETESSSARLVNGALDTSAYVVNNKYDDVLPSLNLSLHLNDLQKVRLAVAKVMARPPIDSLGAGVQRWGVNDFGGNPELDPYRADQVDLSLEHYFEQGGAVAVTGFYKKLNSFVFESQIPNEVGGTFTQPANGEGGQVSGVEFSANIPFERISDALSGWGLFANYTIADSSVSWKTPWSVTQFDLPGLSRNVANAVIWYSKGGFSSRVSYRSRESYVGYGPNAAANDLTYTKSEAIVDFETSYTFGPKSLLKGTRVMFQINNLTDEPYRTYAGIPERIGTYETYGTRYFVGFRFEH